MDVQRAQAVLFGLALGDALGCPVEFNSLHQIKETYGPDGILEPPDPAYYTDDTQMTIGLTEGLLENSLYTSLDSQMTSIGQRFLTWMHSTENTRSPGNTVMAGLARYESGISWRESGLPNSKGCGSAMRVAPIGCLYREDPPRLWEVASASSFITHRHPTAIAAAVAAAYAVALALADVPPQDFIPHILVFCDGLSDELDTVLLRVGHVLGWGSEEAALDHIGQGWAGEEAVALALYCVLRYPDDYAACVRRGANTNGDSDSIACIAGGIMGARLGLEAIPWEWIDRCENRDYLFDLGERVAQAQ